jgi:predicted nucleic acid-binding protein
MGLTVLDAGVVIAVLDARDAHHAAARDALREGRDLGDRLVLPASAYAECLVGPARQGSDALEVVDALLDQLPVTVEPATRTVAAEAAGLRAKHGRSLRLPDALVVATARVLGADLLLTTDARWPDVGVPVRVVAPSPGDAARSSGGG